MKMTQKSLKQMNTASLLFLSLKSACITQTKHKNSLSEGRIRLRREKEIKTVSLHQDCFSPPFSLECLLLNAHYLRGSSLLGLQYKNTGKLPLGLLIHGEFVLLWGLWLVS